MKKLFLMMAMASVAVFSSCTEEPNNNTDDPNTGGNTGGDTTEVVVKELILSVDKSEINLDLDEVATFTVMYGDEDVTAEADIINITDGGFEILSGTTFTTFRPTTHTFYATWDKYMSEDVTVRAYTESDISNIFYRKNIVTKFTATWCTYCPAMTDAIDRADSEYPDRLIEIAMHNGDDLAVSAGDSYVSKFGVAGLPTVNVDMNPSYQTESRSYQTIMEWAIESKEVNPTVSGITLNVSAEGTSKIIVNTEVTVMAEGNYKILCALTQSGFNLEQNGTNDVNYTQDHVLRGFFQEDTFGELLDPEGSLEGQVFQKTYESSLWEGCSESDLEKMSVVIVILNEVSPGVYRANNARECKIGEAKDSYKYELYEEI